MNLSLELLNIKKKNPLFSGKSSHLKIKIGMETLYDTKKMFTIILSRFTQYLLDLHLLEDVLNNLDIALKACCQGYN